MTNEHYAKLERIYLTAPYNRHLYEDNTIRITEEHAEITTRVTEKHFHGGGSMHGSAYFRLLDDAAFFAVNSIVLDRMVYTVSFNIHLVKPVGLGVIKAIGQVKHRSRSRFVAESQLFTEDGEMAAFGTGDFMLSPLFLKDNPEYNNG